MTFCLFVAPLWGQTDSCTYIVEGRVFDQETGEPMSLVSVQLMGTTEGMVTDEEGHFLFEHLCQKEYDLIFSFVGYKQLEHHHDFHHDFITIYLAPSSLMMESIIVEGKAERQALNTIKTERLTKQEMEEVSTLSFADAVSRISGVSTISTGQNIVKPVIHGLHSNRVLVVNNGLRHEFQNWGTDHAPEIDPSMIDNLEVVKGASTVRFGPEALGGVILINPVQPEFSSPFSGSIALTGKSNGQSGEGTVQLQKGFKWLTLQAAGSWLQQGDLEAPDYMLTNTGKREHSYGGGLRIHPLPELFIEGYYSRFDQELGILRGSVNGSLNDLLRALEAETPNFTQPFSYDIAAPRQTVQHDLYKAKIQWLEEKHSFTLQYGYQINRRQEFDVRRGTNLNVPNINLELNTHQADAIWQHTGLGAFSGQAGIQVSVQANDNIAGTNTVPFIPNYDQTRYGGYLIETFEFGDAALEAGVRYDWQTTDIIGRQPNNLLYRNTVTFESVTATIGFRQKWENDLTFRTNIGTAWRPPNIAELYRFGRHLSFLEYGLWRHELDPERDVVSTRNILTEEDRPVPNETGYKWITSLESYQENLQWEMTAYVNYVENFIYARPAGLTRTVRGTSPFFIYDQSDALFWGVDLTLRHQHSDRLESTFRGSYLWSKQIQEDDFFAGQPPAQVNYDVAWEPQLTKDIETRFSVGGSYTFEQFQAPRILTVDEVINAFRTDLDLFSEDASDFDIAAPPPGFFLLSASARIGWKGLVANFRVTNALNTRFRQNTDRLRYFADDLGRNFILTLQYSF